MSVCKCSGCCTDKGKWGLNLKTKKRKGTETSETAFRHTFITNAKWLGRLCAYRRTHVPLSVHCLPTPALPVSEDLSLAQFAPMPTLLLPRARLQKTDIVPKYQCKTYLLAINNKIKFKHFSKTDFLIYLVIELDGIPQILHTRVRSHCKSDLPQS